jgi:hypothetical protein
MYAVKLPPDVLEVAKCNHLSDAPPGQSTSTFCPWAKITEFGKAPGMRCGKWVSQEVNHFVGRVEAFGARKPLSVDEDPAAAATRQLQGALYAKCGST